MRRWCSLVVAIFLSYEQAQAFLPPILPSTTKVSPPHTYCPPLLAKANAFPEQSSEPNNKQKAQIGERDFSADPRKERKKAHYALLKEQAKNRKAAEVRRKKFGTHKRDKKLEELVGALRLLDQSEAAEKKEGHTWIKRPDRARLMRLRHLKVGESYEGMVITVNQYGCYVDFGAERDGYVRVRDLSDSEFILDARDYVKQGDTVTFHVGFVAPEEGVVTGTLFPVRHVADDLGDRTPLSEVRVDDELWGEVTKVSNYGAFVDCGVEVDGFLHVMYYPKKPRGALTQDVFYPGQRLRVYALEVDQKKRRLKLTAERPESLPIVEHCWWMEDLNGQVLNEEDMYFSDEDEDRPYNKADYDYVDEEGEEDEDDEELFDDDDDEGLDEWDSEEEEDDEDYLNTYLGRNTKKRKSKEYLGEDEEEEEEEDDEW